MAYYKVDKGKYDVPFDEKQLSLDIQTFLKNIVNKSTYSDEQMIEIKKKLNNLSGEFINSLNESVFKYTSMNQLTTVNDFYSFQMEHSQNFIYFVEDQFENVPYTLRYYIID